jgi:DNA-cytosine methyltransferase
MINVLSLCGGISTAQIALQAAGIEYNWYFESEIDKNCIKAVKHNFPKTIHLGDIMKINVDKLPRIDLLVSGTPCQGFSNAGKQLQFDDPRSQLFFQFVKIFYKLRKKNPNIKFLFENVRMKKVSQDIITKYLGVEPVMIDSALVCAQTRKRMYWQNFSENIEQPEDRGIYLRDILEPEVSDHYYLSGTALNRLLRELPAIDTDKSYSLGTKNNSGGGSWARTTTLISSTNPRRRIDDSTSDKAPTLLAHQAKGGTDDIHIIWPKKSIMALTKGDTAQYYRVYDSEGKAPNLGANGHTHNIVVHNLQPRQGKGKGGKGHLCGKGDLSKAYCLDTGANQAVELSSVPVDYRYGTLSILEGDKALNIDANYHKGMDNHAQRTMIMEHGLLIRRLTEKECCRLQGIPENFFIKNGKFIISSTAQYKALGNGWQADTITHIFSYYKKYLDGTQA